MAMSEAFALEMPSRDAIGFDRARRKADVGRGWIEAVAIGMNLSRWRYPIKKKKGKNLEAKMAAPDVIKELVACGLVCLKATQHSA
jgi:hypothetical protein